MTRKLIATCVAASLVSFPALAQTTTAGAALALPPPPDSIQPLPADPAGVADLRPGARVVDPDGVELGRVVGVTAPRPRQNPQAFVTLQEQGVTVALPVASITLADGALTARETRAEVWGPQ